MFLVSFIEKFNYEYCINLNTDTKEIKMVRNSHFCYREGRTGDANIKYISDLPNKLSEESVSFTLTSDGKLLLLLSSDPLFRIALIDMILSR